MTLYALKNQLSDFHQGSTVIADFTSVLEPYIHAEPQPDGFETYRV